MKADLFRLELLLHQLRDHSVVTRFHSRWHVNVLHVFGLENILHSCRENDSQTFVIQLRCFCCFPDRNQPPLVYVPMFLVYCLLFFLSRCYIALFIIVHSGKAVVRQETRLLKWLTSENIKLHWELEDVWVINLTTYELQIDLLMFMMFNCTSFEGLTNPTLTWNQKDKQPLFSRSFQVNLGHQSLMTDQIISTQVVFLILELETRPWLTTVKNLALLDYICIASKLGKGSHLK